MTIDSENKKSGSRTAQHGTLSLFFIFLLSLLSSSVIPTATAQAGPSNVNPQYSSFSPSMAIIISVLLAGLLFMALFSVYIRSCADTSGSPGSRQTLSMRTRRPAAVSLGLDTEVIETFPTFVFSAVKDHKIGKSALECAVCLNEFGEHETLRLIPKCDHVFHPECIDAWLESHVTCPVCRANLIPVPGESVQYSDATQLGELYRETEVENSRNGEIAIQVGAEDQQQAPELLNRASSMNQNRPPRSGSVRGSKLFGKFRSHSTGHSLVRPGDSTDRFTLRLPEEVRKEMMKRALLNRTASCGVAALPRESSSRKGYRTGEESTRVKSNRQIDPLDRVGMRSDRWVFSLAPPFFSRESSMKSPKVTADDGEESTSSKTPKGVIKMPSFKCLEPKGDEAGLISADSARPPV